MALLTPLALADAQRLSSAFGLDVVSIEPLTAGSVNSNFRLTDSGGGHWFARLYEEQDAAGARAELTLVKELAGAGVPVIVARPRLDDAPLAEHEGKAFAIFPWVDGEILCQKRVTPAVCDRVGRALAAVHRASASLSALPRGRFRVADLRARLERVERQAPGQYADAVAEIRQKLDFYESRRDTGLPSGLVHGDLFRDNVLWNGEEISALIDFESASAGPFAYDVIVTVMAWCYGDRFDPALVAALISGYDAVRPLEAREIDAMRVEGAIGALRFATTRITDYSMRAPPGNPPLRDYCRFLARLMELESGRLDEALDPRARRPGGR
jgi:homoserine kinase type II